MNAQYEAITAQACTTDCILYAKGTCGYRYNQKHQCPRWVAIATAGNKVCRGCSFYDGCSEISSIFPSSPACSMYSEDFPNS